jgi:hypothetical protein
VSRALAALGAPPSVGPKVDVNICLPLAEGAWDDWDCHEFDAAPAIVYARDRNQPPVGGYQQHAVGHVLHRNPNGTALCAFPVDPSVTAAEILAAAAAGDLKLYPVTIWVRGPLRTLAALSLQP